MKPSSNKSLKKIKNLKVKLKPVKQLCNIDFFYFVSLLKHKRTVMRPILVRASLPFFRFYLPITFKIASILSSPPAPSFLVMNPLSGSENAIVAPTVSILSFSSGLLIVL